MNRKQRRAALKQSPPSGDPAGELFAQGVRSQQQNQLAEAARLYKRLLVLRPDHAEAHNNLGRVLHAQGKLTEASAHFAQALALMPQLYEQSGGIYATLIALLPPIGEAMRHANAAWPKRLTLDQLFGSAGSSAIAADPMLLCLLQSIPAREIALERVLTSLRLSLLNATIDADKLVSAVDLAFCCALAKQCFINEYIFATTADEDAQVDRLQAAIAPRLPRARRLRQSRWQRSRCTGHYIVRRSRHRCSNKPGRRHSTTCSISNCVSRRGNVNFARQSLT